MRQLLRVVATLFSVFASRSVALVARQQQQWQVGQPVRTSSGNIYGHGAGNRPSVSEYLAIPYAKPPVGDLRWAKPQKFEGNETIDNYEFAPDCPGNILTSQYIVPLLPKIAGEQTLFLLSQIGQTSNPMDEDCLYLNVWTKPQTGEEAKAVIFFIHGGGFQLGTTRSKIIDGQFLADAKDVVVVTTSYRENVLGFPGVPGNDEIPQNPGLLDIRMALEWVRDNIAAFGGDPDRIMVVGEDSGGVAVDYFSYAYPDDPIAHAMVSQSGVSTSFTDPAPLDNEESWYMMSIAVGCGDATEGFEATVDCMRQISWKDVLQATVLPTPLINIMGAWKPTVDNVTVFRDYHERGEKGQFAKIPYLLGTNGWEAGFFRIMSWFTFGQPDHPDLDWEIFNMGVFHCPTSEAAQYRVQNDVPAYRYLYLGDYRNMALSIDPPSGSWHGAEMPLVFRTAEATTNMRNSKAEDAVQDWISTKWTDFAKDPTTAFDESMLYNATGKTLMMIGKGDEVEPSLGVPAEFDTLCPMIQDVKSRVRPQPIGEFVLFGDQDIKGIETMDSIGALISEANVKHPLLGPPTRKT